MQTNTNVQNIVIMGGYGKEFHVFQSFYNTKKFRVISFTSFCISKSLSYPSHLAGPLYPNGIPIEPEDRWLELVRTHCVDEIVLAYHHTTYEKISQKEKMIRSYGIDFKLPDVQRCMMPCGKKTLAVTCVNLDIREVVLYKIQEILSPKKSIICDVSQIQSDYPNIDYFDVVQKAEKEAEFIIWKSNQSDIPYINPNLHINVLSSQDELDFTLYYPGRINLELADVILILGDLKEDKFSKWKDKIVLINPKAIVITANLQRGKGNKAVWKKSKPDLEKIIYDKFME